MKLPVLSLGGLLAMPVAASAAAEQYMCYRVSDKEGGTYKQDDGEYVALSINPLPFQKPANILTQPTK